MWVLRLSILDLQSGEIVAARIRLMALQSRARARSISKSNSNNPRWQRWLRIMMITMMISTWSSIERRDGEQKEKRHYQRNQQESSDLVCPPSLCMGLLPGMPPLLAKSQLAVVGAESLTVTLSTCKSGLTLLHISCNGKWNDTSGWTRRLVKTHTAQVLYKFNWLIRRKQQVHLTDLSIPIYNILLDSTTSSVDKKDAGVWLSQQC